MTQPSNPNELCPLCGSVAELHEQPSRKVAFCNNYSCGMYRHYIEISQWNTRANTPQLEQPKETTPSELDKAIERLENEVAVSESDGDQFSRDIIAVCKEAKQVRELREFKDGVIANMPKCGACAEGLFCGSTMHAHDKDCVYSQLRSQRELIEKLVEAIEILLRDESCKNKNQYGQIEAYSFHPASRMSLRLQEALSLAHEQGFGKK